MSDLKVENYKVVSFTYSILNEKGEVKEQNDIPMDYVHGADKRVFPEVMQAMDGAKIGDTKEIVITPINGFGEYDENKSFRDKIENVPAECQIVGVEVSFQDEDGEQLTMKVVSIENGEIFLDGNHPFAGKTVTFKITVKGIRDAAVEEVGSGIAEEYQLNQFNPTVH